ncbi:Aldo-keto reductase family 1 member B1 [Plecturocebus cupreus]
MCHEKCLVRGSCWKLLRGLELNPWTSTLFAGQQAVSLGRNFPCEMNQATHLGAGESYWHLQLHHLQAERTLKKSGLKRKLVMGLIRLSATSKSLTQEKLIQYCQSRGSMVTVYRLLGSPNRPRAKGPFRPGGPEDPTKNNETIARFSSGSSLRGTLGVIPTSVTLEHIAENFKVFD